MAEANNYKQKDSFNITAVTRQASSPDNRSSPDKGLGMGSSMIPLKNSGTADMQPVEKTRNKKDKTSPVKGHKNNAGDQQNSQESDSFYKMYNKEIKVNQDEIPIILAELTDAAYNFISRENYEKALILLQKTEGVLEVVSLEGCTRDRYILFITYNNMAMCFQKLGMLEECIIYLKGSIQQISDEKFFKKRRLSKRSRRMRLECKLKLQLCAIMSQTQNHTEALDNARKSVKLVHQMFRDQEELSQVYIDKINFKENLQAAQEQSDLEDDERDHIIQLILDSSPAKKLPKNFLEQSISLAERLSIKMCPVIKEVLKRLVGAPPLSQGEKKRGEEDFDSRVLMPKSRDADLSAAAIKAIGVDTSVIEAPGDKNQSGKESKHEDDDEDLEDEKPDMRSVLGFLNQNEWVFNLNIGNIMQIQPITMRDLLSETNDELELGRDVFLENLSILTVSYFCMSTEMRFLLQSRANFLKPEVKRDRELESEYWHAKALEMACTFLPSECPLLNHVLLSYQKHHDPSQQPIKEDEESNEQLQVLRPLKGIESSKYQPIIRNLPQIKVSLSPVAYKTLLADAEEFEFANFTREKPQLYQPQIMPTNLQEPAVFSTDALEDFGKSHAHLKRVPDATQLGSKTSSEESKALLDLKEQPGIGNILNQINQTLMGEDMLGESSKVIDPEEITLDVLEDAKAIQDDKDLHDKLMQQIHNVRRNSDQLNQIEWDLPKSGVYSPDSYQNMQANLLKADAIQSQISKINQEMGQLNLSHENNQINNSIEELFEKQIFEAEDSPEKQIKKSSFGSHESIIRGDALLAEDTGDSMMYDKIIQKIIDNPKIDKRTLMQRFIVKIEMESNNAGGIADELNQIKKFVQGLGSLSKQADRKLLNNSLNAEEQSFSEDDVPQNFNPMQSIGDDQIAINQSVDQISVPQESSGVFHIGLNNLVQVTSNVPNPNNLQVQRGKSNQVRKQGSAKVQAPKKFQDVKDKRKPSGQLKPQIFNELGAKNNLRAPNHNLSQHNASTGPMLISGEVSVVKKKPQGQKRESQVSQSILEQDSLFKDMEITEYQGEHSAVSYKQLKVNEFESSAISHNEDESHKSQSTKNIKLVEPEKAKVTAKNRLPSSDNRHSSERKLSSHSRPNTSMTQPTRHSSAFLKKKKRNTLLANQTNPNERERQIKQRAKRPGQSKSNSSSSAKRIQVRGLDQQANLGSNKQFKHLENRPADRNKENIQQNNQIARKLSQAKVQRNAHKKRVSNYQDLTLKKDRPASSMALISKPNHNTSQHSQHFENIDKRLNKNFQKRQHFSQTKFVCHQKPKEILQRRRKNATKQRSAEKSSGKKCSRSGSTEKPKSKSLASGSEQNRILQNELAHQSFDTVFPENYFSKKNQTSSDARRNNPTNHSLIELQRKVLENQKMLMGMLNQKRSGSGDSSRCHSNEQKAKRRLSKHDSSQPQFKAKGANLLALELIHDRLKNSSQQSDSQIIELDNQKQSQMKVAHNKRKQPALNQNSISQQVAGLSEIIKPNSFLPNQQTALNSENQRKSMNKTLMYLRQLQKSGGALGKKEEDRYKAFQNENTLRQNLINEVNYLKSKMKEQIILAHQNKESPGRKNSNSVRRSGDRERKRSNSRSPTQPTKARIPKKKLYDKNCSQGQILGTSAIVMPKPSEQSASVHQILNCSVEDIAKILAHKEQADLDQKQRIKAFNSILPQRILLKAKNVQMRGIAADKEEFEEQEKYKSVKRQADQFLGQIIPIVGESQHSLSMFDSEIELSNNKNSVFQPLQHQFSQNEILGRKQIKSKGEELTPKNNRLKGNFVSNPNHSMSLQQPEGKFLSQTRLAVSKKVLKKALDRQSATQSVVQQQKLITAQSAAKQLIR